MDPNEFRERIQEIIQEALKKDLNIEMGRGNGSLSAAVADLSARLAEVAAMQAAQLEFDLISAEHGPDTDGDIRKVSPKNKLNNLSGAQWLWFTKSVIRTSYPSILGHDLRKRQGGNKPPQLMQDLIEFFTKPDGLVLDPFAGAGGTALGAHLAGRNSVNIEINLESIAIYHEVCKQEGFEPHEFIEGDCREVLATFPDDSFDFIATDPPYSPELEQTMSGVRANAPYGRQNRKSSYVTYSDDPRDLSRVESFDAYFHEMTGIGKELLRVLKPEKYMAMILRDAYQDGRCIPTSAIIVQHYSNIGWVFKGEKIWYATGARIRPYGYPNAFVPNIIHQNILIFRKE
jgi:DNA modification methylase